MHVMDAAIKGSMGGRSIHPSMHRGASIISVSWSFHMLCAMAHSSVPSSRLAQGRAGMRNCNAYLFAESTRELSIFARPHGLATLR